MFTGLIEEIGIVRHLSRNGKGAVITVQCKKILDDLKLGDSISINGACQTAVKIGDDFFNVEVSEETIKIT
ncbi:MAG: riboflavin synthase, partial [Candidatus Gastranaerophilales bacterium]|nr:riboflavin synthase [Candidatus Gastranaerophilales bacterium]